MTMRQICLLTALSLFMMMVNIDYTAVNLALVTIASDIGSHLNQVQWLLSGYVLAWAALLIPGGKLADIKGRKRLALIGLILFILGSLVTGVGQVFWVLVAGRVLQGAAGAVVIPTVYSFIHANFNKQYLGIALGIVSLGIGLGMALGPTFGGIMLTYISWRWIFFINVPLGLFVAGLVHWSAREEVVSPEQSLDLLSASLLGMAIIAMLLAIGQLHNSAAHSNYFYFWLVTSSISLLVFIQRQKQATQPLIVFSIFKNRNFITSSTALAIEQFCFTSVVIMMALYLQEIHGYSVLMSSMIFLPLSLMTGVISPFGGKLVAKFGFKKPSLWGSLILIVGLFGLTTLRYDSPLLGIVTWLLVTGAGMGIMLTALQTGILATVDEQQVGVASAIFILFALLGNAIGVLISTLIYEKATSATLMTVLYHNLSALTASQLRQIEQLVTNIGNHVYVLSTFSSSMQQHITAAIPTALTNGLIRVMTINMGLIFVVSIMLLFMVREQRETRDDTSIHVKV
ncbi:MAG: MFS transporter [Gammaproteobacteria bacterium]